MEVVIKVVDRRSWVCVSCCIWSILELLHLLICLLHSRLWKALHLFVQLLLFGLQQHLSWGTASAFLLLPVVQLLVLRQLAKGLSFLIFAFEFKLVLALSLHVLLLFPAGIIWFCLSDVYWYQALRDPASGIEFIGLGTISGGKAFLFEGVPSFGVVLLTFKPSIAFEANAVSILVLCLVSGLLHWSPARRNKTTKMLSKSLAG